MAALRWIGRNLSTLILAFILAVIVWGSAVTSADPDESRVFTIPIEVIGRDASMEILNTLPEQMLLTLFAPRSILDQIESDDVQLRAWIDLTGLESGTHTIPVNYQMPEDIRPVRVESVAPQKTDVILEQVVSRTIPIQTVVVGEPALGYQTDTLTWSDQEVSLSGLLSAVEQVDNVEVELDITGANKDIKTTLTLYPRVADGALIPGVSLSPEQVTVTQTITLRGGYRNMVIEVMTMGQVADGYRQTNITVSPPNVMVFSPDPNLLGQLPGYIETNLLDLTDSADDIETVLALNLPEGISIIGDPNVLVQVGVAAIEDSLRISRNVEIIGVLPEQMASVSPDIVEVIVFGPIPILDGLTDVDVRVVVDVTGLSIGIYSLAPQVIILPDRIQLQALSPETVQVEITEAAQIAPTLTITPTLTPSP
jgi:YbbR domain-containing protein